jgi:membrane protein implicated in regulation of membrane protease activity
VVAVGSAAVFVALLYTVPAWAFLLTTIGVLFGVAIVLALIRRPIGGRRRRRREMPPLREPTPEVFREVPGS